MMLKKMVLYRCDLQRVVIDCSKSRIILYVLGCNLCDYPYIYNVLGTTLHNWCKVGVRCGLM